jgi:hypothetical protein
VVWPQNHWCSFSRFGLKTGGDSFIWFGLKTGGFGFPGLDLTTGSYGLVIWASKSPRWFLGLVLKTKWATICRLRHKTNRKMKTTQGTCRDLVACFTWKQVRLGFPSLASRLVEARRGWCMWHHRGGCIEIKSKTDRSMRRAASDPATLTLSFLMY